MIQRRCLSRLLTIFATLSTATLMAAPPPPVLGALANATYPGIGEQPITLRDGIWEGEVNVEEGASRPRVMLVPGFRIVGDLDGDGASEAVVMLAVTRGGSGTFNHLAVADRRANGDVNVRAVTPLGDRVQVRYARIETGELLIDTVEAGVDDAACCPGTKRLRRWRLVGASLEEGVATEAGRLGPDDLGGGITWRLTHLDHGIRVTAPTPPYLRYVDGRIEGSAGCNQFFGTAIAGSGPGDLKVGPLGTTRKACEVDVMDLESTFMRHLNAIERFAFLGGQLIMSYRDGERVGNLVFVAE